MGFLDDFDKAFNDIDEQPDEQPRPGSSKTNPFTVALQAGRARQAEELAEDEDDDSGDEHGLRAPLPTNPIPSRATGDFNIHYDTETPLRPIDIGGPDQDQRIADFVSKEIDNNSQGLDVANARKFLGLKDKKSILPGTEFRLLDHQAIGVAWMVKMETERKEKGGILADDMGLGKTVQMIALMSKNQPTDEDEEKTTLIVVPAALMQQWKDEIETKTNGLFEVHIHHGKDKLKKASQVRRKDVVVTSYQTLCMDFSTPNDVEAYEESEWLAKHGGPLARTKFYRVIADEAQFIRNRSTRSSVSMAYVRAKYRWMLTGTPVTNTLADLYGLLRFGRFAPWNDWPSFNEHIAKVQYEDAPLAGQRAQVVLKPLLLRRTKNSTLEGEPILKLPTKDIELVRLQFTPEERDIYDSFESRAKIKLNKFIRERTLVKHHHFVLVMILRLRQLCCHPNLILGEDGTYEDVTATSGDDLVKEVGRARRIMGIAWVQKMKQEFLVRAAATEILDFQDEEAEGEASAPCCPECGEAYGDNGQVLMCGHQACLECIQNIRNAPIAHNGIFGYGTEKENLAAEKAFEEAEAKGHRPCPSCKKMIDMSPDHIHKTAAFEPTDEELSTYARKMRKEKAQARQRSRAFDMDMKMQPLSPAHSIIDLSDSDDGLPDVLSMFKKPSPVKKGKKKMTVYSDDDSADDLPSTSKSKSKVKKTLKEGSDIDRPNKSSSKRRVSAGKRKVAESDVSDVEDHSESPPKRKKRARATPDSDEEDEVKPRKAGHEPSDAVLATWRRGDDDMEPSTKMAGLVNYLREWDASGDKTICYSQWTSMLDLLDIVLAREGVRTLRFDGKMDRLERDRAIASFKRAGGPKIMLISTKAGSVGLNLVCANRVVNMDLSWNYASESQAYDRQALFLPPAPQRLNCVYAYSVHRIGQEKPVFIKRLVVENTIEERMLRLQEVKTGLAEAALGEGAGGKLHKLSVKDIKYLFGMTTVKAPGPNGGRGPASGRESPF